MPTLAELQAGMAAAILGDAPAPAGVAAERLTVHRATTLGTLTGALADAFPVVALLVGERFFAQAAARFVPAHPPAAPRLAEYGAGFPEFLAVFPPARGLAYLPDVARLDWAVHRAYHAADRAALRPGQLAALDPAAFGSLRLGLHPSVQLLASRFPVDRIWQAHHGAGELSAIDLSAPVDCRLLIDRGPDGIRLLPLGAGELALLQAFDSGASLDEAAGAAAADADLDLPALLARHLARGSFAALEPP
jgi:hypothetical protein